MAEPCVQLLIRLPDSLARRFKRHVAARQRSKYIERLLEEALPPDAVADDEVLHRSSISELTLRAASRSGC